MLSVRIVNVLTLLLVVITFIMALVQGHNNSSYYLLACNITISALVGIVVNWWYRSGDLGSEKFWYILVVAGVLAFQCVTIDIYVFNVFPEASVTTPSPVNASTTPSTGSSTVFTWATFRPTNQSFVQQLATPIPAY